MMTAKKTSFPKYPAYKDSGVEWLGEIPEGWEVVKLKYLVQIVKRIIGYEGPNILSITQKGIKIKNISSGEGQLAQDYSKYQIVEKGDFAMNHMDLLTGWVDKSQYSGVISPDYRVFKLKSDNIETEYVLILFQLLYKSKVFYANGQGVSMLGRWRLPADNFNNFFIPIPTLKEQTAIAHFLDDKTAKIDRAIAQKERMIALLKERKQIIIQNAVTKGLNYDLYDEGDVPDSRAKNQSQSLNHQKSKFRRMKDSGVEWIGEIPEHWEVRKFKFLCHITTGAKNTEDKIENGLYPFYVRSQTPERINSYSFDGEAILTAGDGAGVGKVFHYVNGKFDFHQRVYKFSKFKNIAGKFLFYYLRSTFHNVALNGEAKSTVDSLRLPLIQNFKIILPSFGEQGEIINFIETQSTKIDQAISLQQTQIEKLKKYKATLIDSAVTGKIKVSEL